MLYAVSCFICTPSAIAQDGPEALGALGGEAALRRILGEAGFTVVERHGHDVPLNMVLVATKEGGGAIVNGELADIDGVGQAELVARGDVTATELVAAAIERIEALNPALNAVVYQSFDEALARAATNPTGPFRGVPYLLKDLVVERAGTPFTEGSRFLEGNESTFTSELATRLERAGLVIVGRTNTPEFGMAPACEPVLHGPTRNPWNTDRSTSGSSGGSAAAVASGMVAMAHGNDLGGSIRYPASACGLFGLKPTRARCRSAPSTATPSAVARPNTRSRCPSATAPRSSTWSPAR